MPVRRNFHRGVSVLLIAAVVSCGDAVAPGGTNELVPIPVTDLIGTYMLTKFDGQLLPAVRAPSSAHDFQQDTVFAGCLVLGDLLNPPASTAGDVNVTWLFDAELADAYLRTPTQCPPFLRADHQEYDWYGSHGTWSFCSVHACENTDFTAATVNGEMVISARDSAHQTIYVKQ